MSGAAMRELYDAEAKERQLASTKSAGVASGKSRKNKSISIFNLFLEIAKVRLGAGARCCLTQNS